MRRPGQQQAGDVGAGDEEHETYRAQQRCEDQRALPGDDVIGYITVGRGVRSSVPSGPVSDAVSCVASGRPPSALPSSATQSANRP